MQEIDYNELFELDSQGEKETEPETDAQGTKEGGAEPSVEIEERDDGKGTQSPEENARFAAARRKAEAERDAAIEKAKADAKAEADRQIDEAFRESGLVNPYTKKPVQSKADYDEYKRMREAERKKQIASRAGMSEQELDELAETLPAVQEAKAAQAKAEKLERELREKQAREMLEDELRQISELDPAVKKIEDLEKLDCYEAIVEKVKRGYSLIDAYKIANLDRIRKGTEEKARQAAANAAASKAHLTPTASRGRGGVSVPAAVMENYRALMPELTDAEIRAHYAKNHRDE